jgi:hypothetical protein
MTIQTVACRRCKKQLSVKDQPWDFAVSRICGDCRREVRESGELAKPIQRNR